MSISTRIAQYERLLGNWEIGKKLGSGSGGKTTVFEAIRNQAGFQEAAALKVIELTSASGDIGSLSDTEHSGYQKTLKEAQEKAIQEVELMYRLRGNTNIVGCQRWELCEWSSQSGFGCDLLILMDRLECLEAVLQQGCQMEESEIIRLGIDLCRGLELLERNQIVHRDIKPHNIFFDANGSYKLGDLGVARILEDNSELMAATRHGTPAYAAPEQLAGRYDHRTDIYSLGLVLYELGNENRLPFAASRVFREADISRRLSGEPFPKPERVNPFLAQVIRKACAHRPEERYQTAAEFRQALEALAASGTEATPPIESTLPEAALSFQYQTETISLKPQPEHSAELEALIKEAEGGDLDAQHRIALLVADQYPKMAMELLQKLAALDYPPALGDVGVAYIAGELAPKNEELGLQYLRKGVKLGNAHAQTELAMCYLTGRSVPADTKLGMYWLKQAYLQGFPTAKVYMGVCHFMGYASGLDDTQAVALLLEAGEHGDLEAQRHLGLYYLGTYGGPRNPEEALKWFLMAAKQGDIESIREAVKLFLEKNSPSYQPERAAWLLEQLARAGDAEAQAALGKCYCDGQGVPEDSAQMFYWYRKAAEQGHAIAQVELVKCYLNGIGTTKNQEKAIIWARRSADQGNRDAMLFLSTCYAYGLGVVKNLEKADSLYREAVKGQTSLKEKVELFRANHLFNEFFSSGDRKTGEEALALYAKTAPKGLNDAAGPMATLLRKGITVKGVTWEKAVQFLSRAAEQGDFWSQFELGVCYWNGEGLPQDPSAAVYWYEKAAQQGYVTAQRVLADCYATGTGVSIDFQQAEYWYRKALERGRDGAMTGLGYICQRRGDMEQAAQWYEQAADKGSIEAMYRWGIFCVYGIGREKDPELGLLWLQKAADKGNVRAMTRLEQCYQEGIGCRKDPSLADYWHQKAQQTEQSMEAQ